MSKYGYEEGFSAEFYDPIYGSRIPDVDFFKNYAKDAKGRILELASGTGRVLIPLAQAGYEITGLDLSTFMFDVCRRKLVEQPMDVQKRVNLVQVNMADFRLNEKFTLAIIPAHSFQILIKQKDQENCLRSIAAHLKPHGRLIVDVFHPDFPRLYDPQFQQERQTSTNITLDDGRRVRVSDRIAAYHKSEQYNDVEQIYYVHHPDGKEERLVQTFSMHYFFRYEMEYLLQLCGFNVIEIFGNFDKTPFTDISPEMIFVAEKK